MTPVATHNAPDLIPGHVQEAYKRLKMLGDNGPASAAHDLNWHRADTGHRSRAHA